ncbi:hypothetical protein CALVIDRAFT_537378 [Calocera viscosa TUFC12733]|uniref:Uncharacterized protein n=1 Tax=Calocera viscosa (strain TUFC12733) TaxID=1330018 RepID=A0A167LZ95_CALVF|nr:hypothetical protein CALVIDRAFT_537378 [Calocera viscosa TUFC12733]
MRTRSRISQNVGNDDIDAAGVSFGGFDPHEASGDFTNLALPMAALVSRPSPPGAPATQNYSLQS